MSRLGCCQSSGGSMLAVPQRPVQADSGIWSHHCLITRPAVVAEEAGAEDLQQQLPTEPASWLLAHMLHRTGLAVELIEAAFGRLECTLSAAQERPSPLGRRWRWLAVWDGEVAHSGRAADGASCCVVGLRCLREWGRAESALQHGCGWGQ